MLNTVWNDDGEGIFDENWFGVLFGAAAGWQHGESSEAEFIASYGPGFHRDQTGKISQAQQALMAAHALLKKAGSGRRAGQSLLGRSVFARRAGSRRQAAARRQRIAPRCGAGNHPCWPQARDAAASSTIRKLSMRWNSARAASTSSASISGRG